jgi:hypothetical protein
MRFEFVCFVCVNAAGFFGGGKQVGPEGVLEIDGKEPITNTKIHYPDLKDLKQVNKKDPRDPPHNPYDVCPFFGYKWDDLKYHELKFQLDQSLSPAYRNILVFEGSTDLVPIGITDFDRYDGIMLRRWSGICGEVLARLTIGDKTYLVDVLMSVKKPNWGDTRGLLINKKGRCAHSQHEHRYRYGSLGQMSITSAPKTLDGWIKYLLKEYSSDFFFTTGIVLVPHMILITDLSSPGGSLPRRPKG